MALLLSAWLMWAEPGAYTPPTPPQIITGELTYYAPNLMERVYNNRLAWGHVTPCDGCVGKIAVLDRAHMGKRVWLSVDGGVTWVGELLIVDCASAHDLARLRQRGLLAELDYNLWRKLHLPERPVVGQIRFTN